MGSVTPSSVKMGNATPHASKKIGSLQQQQNSF